MEEGCADLDVVVKDVCVVCVGNNPALSESLLFTISLMASSSWAIDDGGSPASVSDSGTDFFVFSSAPAIC